MPARTAVQLIIPVCLLIAGVASQSARPAKYGPEVKSFLDFCRHEENELDYQIKHNEIDRKEYIRSRNRIAVHREEVLKIVRQTRADVVPELHVVTLYEVDALIEDGARVLKTVQPGATIAEKWRYRARVLRGETFYVFERLARE